MALVLKHAFRRLGRAPEFTLLSILMLAFGVAMSTAAFSITNNALLRPLPFHDPGQLVRVTTESGGQFIPPLAPGFAMDLCDQLGDVGEFGLFMQQEQNVGDPGQPPQQQEGMSVAANVLNLLGIQPRLGRGFLPGEDQPGKPPVILLTDRFWHEHYAADPNVLGKVLRVETTNFTVVGVLPPEFDEALVWSGCKYVTLMTVWPNWRADRTAKWLGVMGRLRPGVSIGKAQARVEVFVRQMAHDHPVEMGTDDFRVSPLGSSYASPQIKTVYWLIVGLSVLVLVVACANLGAIQIARAFARQQELAVRTALGATRSDLVAALAAESALIAAAGTILGLLVANWSRALIARWLQAPVVPLDGRVILFAVVAGVLAMLCFGVIPAWLSSGNLAQALKETSRGATGGRAQQRWKSTLVVGQLALALVLVSTAASFVLGVRTFLHRDRGWRPEGLVCGVFQVTWNQVQKDHESRQLVSSLEQKLAALPGVQRVAVASDVILYGNADPRPLVVKGADAVAPGHEPQANVTGVNATFFTTVGLTLREGRLFPAEWRRTDPPVVVISASVARQLWPAGSALGHQIRFGQESAWHEVIGVVADATFGVGYATPTTLQVYRPIQETEGPWFNFVLQTSQPATVLERPIRAILAQIDPDMMVGRIGDLPTVLADFASVGPLNGILIAFAVSGLIIALIGLYGVMSQLTQQRRREIGVRLALGADQRQVIGMMLGYGARLLAIGGCVGLVGASIVARLFHQVLPELPMLGLLGTTVIGGALGLAGLVACYGPSWRAARINPVEVLRAE